jgi:phosphoglycolate phosphatase
MTPQFVVFDLDGTLIDGYAAIADALSYAMRRLGREELPLEGVRAMVGHGLERLMEKALGPDLVSDGVRLFRERYPEVAVEKTELMPGVPEVLAELDRCGHVLAVASNKPARFSRLILDAKGVADRFLVISGPDERIPPKPEPAMLRAMMGLARATPAETLVVGDMEIDAEMARAAGCRVVLVPGGSRSREELAEAGADALLGDLTELPAWIAART